MAALDRHVILFRVIDGVVRIERVLHGARNLPVVPGQPAVEADLERCNHDSRVEYR